MTGGSRFRRSNTFASKGIHELSDADIELFLEWIVLPLRQALRSYRRKQRKAIATGMERNEEAGREFELVVDGFATSLEELLDGMKEGFDDSEISTRLAGAYTLMTAIVMRFGSWKNVQNDPRFREKYREHHVSETG
jgi:hypothetical protein